MDREMRDFFSMQTAILFTVIEWIVGSADYNRDKLIEDLKFVKAEAIDSGNAAALAPLLHLLDLLEERASLIRSQPRRDTD